VFFPVVVVSFEVCVFEYCCHLSAFVLLRKPGYCCVDVVVVVVVVVLDFQLLVIVVLIRLSLSEAASLDSMHLLLSFTIGFCCVDAVVLLLSLLLLWTFNYLLLLC